MDVAASSLSDILLSKGAKPALSNGSRDHSEPQGLFPIYHLENPVRWPWHDVIRVLASLLRHHSVGPARTLSLVPYSTWLDRVVRLGGTTAGSTNGGTPEQRDAIHAGGNEETTLPPPDHSAPPHPNSTIDARTDRFRDTNPAYHLVEFFATDFRRMACGSVVLDTRLASEASSTLRDFASVAGDVAARDQILERYVGYWRWCHFL